MFAHIERPVELVLFGTRLSINRVVRDITEVDGDVVGFVRYHDHTIRVTLKNGMFTNM